MKRKDTIKIVSDLFTLCNQNMIEISHFDIKISIWNKYEKDFLKDLIKILSIIDSSDIIDSSIDVWRTEGYYNDTEDITIDFRIDKKKVENIFKIQKND